MDIDAADAVPQPGSGSAPAQENADVEMPSLPIKSEPEQTPERKPGPHYKIRFSLSGHTMSISSLKFSPDGSKLASSGLLRPRPQVAYLFLGER